MRAYTKKRWTFPLSPIVNKKTSALIELRYLISDNLYKITLLSLSNCFVSELDRTPLSRVASLIVSGTLYLVPIVTAAMCHHYRQHAVGNTVAG